MKKNIHFLLCTTALSAAVTAISAQAASLGAGLPVTSKSSIPSDPRLTDLGPAAAGDVKTLTLALAVRNKAALESYVASLADPSSPNFRKFITPQQFAASYGQTPEAVAQVVSYLQSKGFVISQVHANKLLITVKATNAQIGSTFGTSVHNFVTADLRYQAPASKPVIPAAIANVVTAVTGLSNKASFHSRSSKVPSSGALAGDIAPASTSSLGGQPGSYTVKDLASKYNINPLYTKGLTGAGKTIGIATLAGYNQSDAFAYWRALGLNVSSSRITDVLVDGGPLAADGPGSEGAGETTLDVEQAGGVAPGADMRVYLAPNADSGFLDVFAAAINENKVDVLSVSWGSPEIYNDSNTADAFHSVFLQAAAQGIPVIAAAGDAGAFDINRNLTYPNCTTLLTVDFPAADPLVLAAGGTTLPHTQAHRYGPVTVPTERAWGWDYLKDYIVGHYGSDLYYASYYTVGAGGGVSVQYSLPAYQSGLAGVQKSASAQSLLCSNAFFFGSGSGYTDLADLPGGIAGRNLPDVSLNADPYSGYLSYQDGQWSAGGGGTSYVAPQLNGILTLISSGLSGSGRLGAVNPQLYAAFKQYGYGAGSPFKAITAGTNEYYRAGASYNPATGLGSLDVSALAKALGVQ